MPTPNENLVRLHKNLTTKWQGFNVPIEQFETDMQDEAKRRKLHDNLTKQWQGFNIPYEKFTADMGFNANTEIQQGLDVAQPNDNGIAELPANINMDSMTGVQQPSPAIGKQPTTAPAIPNIPGSGFGENFKYGTIEMGRGIQYGIGDFIYNLSDDKIREDIYKYAKAGNIPLESADPEDYDKVIQVATKERDRLNNLAKTELEKSKGAYDSKFRNSRSMPFTENYTQSQATPYDKSIKELNNFIKAATFGKEALTNEGKNTYQSQVINSISNDTWGERQMQTAGNILEKLPEAKGFWANVGRTLPQVIGSAAGALASVYNPLAGQVLMNANMAALTASQYGGTLHQIDKYEADTGIEIDDETRYSVALSTAAIELITEKVRMPGITEPMQKYFKSAAGRMFAKQAVANPAVAKNIINAFAGGNAGIWKIIKNGAVEFAKVSNRQGMEEAAEEVIAQIGQDLVSYAYLQAQDQPGVNEILVNAGKAATMAYVMGPIFGSINMFGKHKSVKDNRRRTGLVSIVKTADGAVYEQLGQNPDGTVAAINEKGQMANLTADQIEGVHNFSVWDFEEFKQTIKQGQQVSDEEVQDAQYKIELHRIATEVGKRVYQGEDQLPALVNGVQMPNVKSVVTVKTVSGEQYQVLTGAVNNPDPAKPMIGINMETGERRMLSNTEVSQIDIVPAIQMSEELAMEAYNRIIQGHAEKKQAERINQFMPGERVQYNGMDAEVVGSDDPSQGIQLKITDQKGKEQFIVVPTNEAGNIQSYDEQQQSNSPVIPDSSTPGAPTQTFDNGTAQKQQATPVEQAQPEVQQPKAIPPLKLDKQSFTVQQTGEKQYIIGQPFESQKTAESTAKKLSEKYPKMLFEVVDQTGDDDFAEAQFVIQAKSKAIVNQPQAVTTNEQDVQGQPQTEGQPAGQVQGQEPAQAQGTQAGPENNGYAVGDQIITPDGGGKIVSFHESQQGVAVVQYPNGGLKYVDLFTLPTKTAEQVSNEQPNKEVSSEMEQPVTETQKKREALLQQRKERGEETQLSEIPETPATYTSNVADLSKPLAPEISLDLIDVEASSIEVDGIKTVKLVEVRGRNSEGKLVGTVRITTDTGSDSFGVIFKDTKTASTQQETLPEPEQVASEGQREDDIEAKKADIERRRQEELRQNYETDKEIELKRFYEWQDSPAKNGIIKQWENNYEANHKAGISIINAKYDAELAVLTEQPVTQTDIITPASPTTANADTQVAGAVSPKAEKNPYEGMSEAELAKEREKIIKGKKKKQLSKEQQKVSQNTYSTPYEIVLQHFATGNKITPQALFSLYGTKGKENDPAISKKVESERKFRFTWVSTNDGLGINEIAESLWEKNAELGYQSQDFRDAVEDVIRSFTSPQQMAIKLLEISGQQNSQEEDEYMAAMNAYYADYDETQDKDSQNEESEELAINTETIASDEDIIKQILFGNYVDQEGNIDVEALYLQLQQDREHFIGWPYDLSEQQVQFLEKYTNDARGEENTNEPTQEDGAIPDRVSIKGQEDIATPSEPRAGGQSEAEEPPLKQRVAKARIAVNAIKGKLAQAQKQLDNYRKSLKEEEGMGQTNMFDTFVPGTDNLFQETPEERQAIAETVKTSEKEVQALNTQLQEAEKALKDLEGLSENQLTIRPETAGEYLSNILLNNEVKQEEAKVNTNPTEAQKEAGNYQKGHVNIQGMDISIENPKGSVRSGTDSKGKKWSITMNNSYGYFVSTNGYDGDQIDVFLGENLLSDKVFVVDQVNPETGEFDESKIMLGFNDAEQAKQAYLSNYSKAWKGFSAITETSIGDFKSWLYDGKKQRKAYSQYKDTPEPENSVNLPKTDEKPAESTPKEQVETPKTDKQYVDELLVKGFGIAIIKGNDIKYSVGGEMYTLTPAQYEYLQYTQKQEDEPKPVAKEIISLDDALTAYNYAEGYTVMDLVEDVERLSDGNDQLDAAVAKYWKEYEDDRALAGRGDMDAAEDEFVQAVEAVLKSVKTPNNDEKPNETDGESVVNLPNEADLPDRWREVLPKARMAATRVFSTGELDAMTANGTIDWTDLNSIIKVVESRINVDNEVQSAPEVTPNTLVSEDRYAELKKRMKDKLNNLNAGFDPEMLAIGSEMAMFHIERGARKFAAYAKAMIEDLGDAVKPYLKSFYKAGRSMPGMEEYLPDMNTDEEVNQFDVNTIGNAEQPKPKFAGEKLTSILNTEPKEAPKDKFINSIKRKIANDERIVNTPQLTALATEAGFVHGVDYTDIKELYDIASFALNQYFADNAAIFNPEGKTAEQVKRTVQILNEKMNLLATETTRSKDQVDKQQFSTPPGFAFIVNWIAQVNSTDTVLEPSAGEGNIAVFAKNTGAKVVVNEIDKNRTSLLKRMFDTVLSEDAKFLHAVNSLKNTKITTVVMNPPFSRDIALGGKMDIHAAEKHIEAALNKLEDGGRLVAIVGRGMSMDSPTHREWFDKIKNKYTIIANISVSGDQYSKKGTNFDNRLVIIDKISDVNENTITGEVSNYSELADLLSGVPNKENTTNNENANRTSGKGQADDASNTTIQSTGKQPGISDVVPSGRSTDSNAGQAKNGGLFDIIEPSGTRKSGEVSAANTPASKPAQKPDKPAGNDKPINTPASSRSNVPASGQLPNNEVGKLNVVRNSNKTNNTTDVGYDTYKPEILVEGAKQHPTKLVESTAMASVSLPEVIYSPSLPIEVVTKGALSDAQLEDVVLAGNSHSQVLLSGERRGFFLGAGTGYGKGRTIAGIILDNWNQGRKRAVWISKNDKAHYDSADYWQSVGGDPKVIFEQKKSNAKIEVKEGVLLTKYGTISNRFDRAANFSANPNFWNEVPQTRLQQIAQWLGKDFDGVIVFDESHKMANAKDTKATRGTKKASNMALAGLELQRMLPNARVVYSSATGATEVTNLVYAQRLGLWGDGTPFGGPENFITAIENSGVAGMELISRDMKSMGLYTAKTLSFDGVSYETITHNIVPEQKALYDKVARAWQSVLQNINQAVEDNNSSPGAKSAALSAFWGAHQRFFSNVIITMQMPSLLNDIQQSIDSGKAIVVQLVNTNEAATRRALAEAKSQVEEGDEIDYDEMDVSPKQSLLEFLRRSFPVAMFQVSTDKNGNEVKIMVIDENGNPVENPESVRKRDELIAEIDRELLLPESPLDILINTFGPDNVAEITGRSNRIVARQDEKGNIRKVEEKRTDRHVAADKDAFMDGKKDILVFSDAGGTGASFHSDLSRANQKQRVHYVLQAGWRADGAVQGFGRSHRSNQAIAPIFKLVTTNLKAQRRFLSSIARRLDQLGALTKGQRQTGGQGILDGSFNLEGSYAKQALFNFYRTVEAGGVTGVTMETLEQQMALKIFKEDENGNRVYNDQVVFNTKMFLNRLMSLEVDLMDNVFESFMGMLEEQINLAKANGSYDEGIEIVKALSTKVIDEQEIYSDPKTGAKTFITTIELEVKNDKQTFDDILHQVTRYGTKFKGFQKEEKSGRIYAIVAQDIVRADGSRDSKYRRFSVITDTFLEYDEYYGKYAKVDIEDARIMWDQEYENYPETRKKSEHIVKGLILPIWNRLPEKINVKRYIDDNGIAHLGRYFSKNDIQAIRKNFEVSNTYTFTVKQLVETLNAGGNVKLSNGFEFNKTKNQGNIVFKISNANPYRDRERLTRAGASFIVKSTMSMSGDFVIPQATAEEVIGSIIELFNAPAIEVEDTNGNPVKGIKVETQKTATTPAVPTNSPNDLTQSRGAIISEPSPTAKQPQAAQANSPGNQFQDGKFDVFTQKHSITGTPMIMAAFKEKVEYSEYQEALKIAKKYGGRYSTYKSKQDNIKSGFVFDNEASRQKFLDEVNGFKPIFRQNYFYSPTEKALNDIKQEKGTVAQFKAMLLKNGSKQAEMDWMQFDDHFPDAGKTITKTDIQDWIDQNRIEIKEVSKSDRPFKQIKEALFGVSKEWEEIYGGVQARESDKSNEYEKRFNLKINGTEYNRDFAYIDAKSYIEANADVNPEKTRTKFYQYKTPGGSDYKEWLLTMPSKKESPISIEQFLLNKGIDPYSTEGMDVINGNKNNPLYIEYSSRYGNGYSQLDTFKSSHWDEPNIVVHVRTQEFTDADGKRVLMIEELQSDWAHSIRKNGSRPSFTIKKEGGSFNVYSSVNNNSTPAFTFESEDEANKMIETLTKVNKGKATDMPFKQTDQWTGLALRRIMQYAADNGFDKLAWTTGEQQADRYDLSKQVDKINWTKKGDTYDISPTKDGSHIGFPVGVKTTNLTKNEVADLVGKEIADKIEAETGKNYEAGQLKQGSLSGLDLAVGGEGMKAFYDKIIPAWIAKNWKKFGVKVETTELDVMPEITEDGINLESGEIDESTDEKYLTVHSIEITPELIEITKGPQPMFRKDDNIIDHYADKHDTMQQYAEKAKELGNRYNVSVKVITNRNQLPVRIQRQMKKNRVYSGIYDPMTDNIYVLVNEIRDIQEVEKTITHEIVGHKGLRGLLGNEAFNQLCDNVYYSMHNADIRIISELYRTSDRLEIADEYMAQLAETGKFPNWFQRVIARVRTMLRKAGLKARYSDADIMYLLWESRRRLLKGQGLAGYVQYKAAESDVIQNVLYSMPRNEQYVHFRTSKYANGTIQKYLSQTGAKSINHDNVGVFLYKLSHSLHLVNVKGFNSAYNNDNKVYEHSIKNESILRSKLDARKELVGMLKNIVKSNQVTDYAKQKIKDYIKELKSDIDMLTKGLQGNVTEEAAVRFRMDDNNVPLKENKGMDTYYVDKAYTGEKGGFYLRFTDDPFFDLKNKYSRWYDTSLSEQDAKDQGYLQDEDGEYYKLHTGLSGHFIDAETLEEAIKKVEAKNWWFRQSSEDNWSIYEADENDLSVIQDTPEGNTFMPYKVLFSRDFTKSTEQADPLQQKYGLLKNTPYIESGQTRVDDYYEPDEPEYNQRKVYKPEYNVSWSYADNANPNEKAFDDIDKAYGDFIKPGDYTETDKYYIPYKEISLGIREVWLDSNDEVVEQGDVIGYEEFALANKDNDFVQQYGTDQVIDTKTLEPREATADALLNDVYSNINKDIIKSYKGNKIEVIGQGKYRTVIISKEDEQILSIKLRIADHGYNPMNNNDVEDEFISIEIANKNETKDRYQGLRSLQYDGQDTYKQIIIDVNERIKDIIESSNGPTGRAVNNSSVRFRIAPDVSSKMVSSKGEQFREMVQDKMLSGKNLLNTVSNRGGVVNQATDFYNAENRMQSRSKAQIEDYNKKQLEALDDIIVKILRENPNLITDNNKPTEAINLYLKAKSALQRNDVEGTKAINDNDDAEWGRNAVEQIVSEFESKVSSAHISELWDAIKKATDFSIDMLYKGNMLSRDAYLAMKNRQYYVPLKSWQFKDEDNPEDFYAYVQADRSAYQGLVKAKGRGSESDDPLAYIQAAAHTAVVVANRNMMKHKVLMLARMNPEMEDLFHIIKIYVTEDGTDTSGNPVVREVVEENGRAIMILGYNNGIADTKDIGDFTELLDNKQIVRKYTRHHKARRASYLVKQHEIDVYENGEKYIVAFTDPNVANAINNANVYQPHLTRYIQNSIGRFNRWLTANFTAKNPAFIPINWIRDFGYAVTAHTVKSDGNIQGYIKAYPGAVSAIHRSLRETADPMNNEMDKLYQNFREFGGETGYVHLQDIKKLKKDIDREVNRKLGHRQGWDKVSQRKAYKAAGAMLDYMALMSENSARFATFVASVKAGKSYEQAATDAKNITVNFNRKGRVSGIFGSLYGFFNATVQGGHSLVNMAKNNKRNFAIAAGTFFSTGLILSELLRSIGPDDDEGNKEYDKLPLWIRQTCLVIPNFAGKGFWTIPLPQGFRMFYSWGVTLSDAMHAKQSAPEATYDILSATSDAFSPFDLNATEVNKGKFPWRSIVPTMGVPIYDVLMNEDFTGKPIHPIQYTEDLKRYTPKTESASKNVNEVVKDFTDLLNKIGGGDQYRQAGYKIDKATGQIERSGWRDIFFNWNPSNIEHTVEYYLGGRGKFFNEVYKTGKAAIDQNLPWIETAEQKEVKSYNIPVVKRLYMTPYEGNYWEEYFELKNQVKDYNFFYKKAQKEKDIAQLQVLQQNERMMIISKLHDKYSEHIDKMSDVIPMLENPDDIKQVRGMRETLIKDFMHQAKQISEQYQKDNNNKLTADN